MSKIKAMLVHNIEILEGYWGEYWVGYEQLQGYSEYNDNIDENTFFLLACRWIDDSGEFWSTEDAKIDYYEVEEEHDELPSYDPDVDG